MVADAEYIWLDVTSPVAMHPTDFRTLFDTLVGAGMFGIVDAQDGYILLKRGLAAARELPDGFFSFARTGGALPRYPIALDYGDSLRLLGFDLYEITEDGRPWTGLRLYWQPLKPLPAGLRLFPFFFDDHGKVLEDTAERPVVSALWYPPEKWRVGETVVMEKLPWPVGDRFNLGLGVARGADWSQQGSRLEVRQADPALLVPLAENGTWAHLASVVRVEGKLQVAVSRRSYTAPVMQRTVQANLSGRATLLGYDVARERGSLVVTLYWQASSPMDRSYTVFLHLEGPGGSLVAQSDGLPAAGTRPTTTWETGEVVTDRRALSLPAEAAAGDFRLAAGMYLLETLERLPVLDRAGTAIGDSVDLGTIALP
jgi:hypothetical protein